MTSTDRPEPGGPSLRENGGPHTFHHEWDSPTPLYYTVAAGVATVTDDEMTSLPPLYDAVDPESLDRLFRSVPPEERRRVEIEFRFADCSVHVSGTGEVTVAPDAVGNDRRDGP